MPVVLFLLLNELQTICNSKTESKKAHEDYLQGQQSFTENILRDGQVFQKGILSVTNVRVSFKS